MFWLDWSEFLRDWITQTNTKNCSLKLKADIMKKQSHHILVQMCRSERAARRWRVFQDIGSSEKSWVMQWIWALSPKTSKILTSVIGGSGSSRSAPYISWWKIFAAIIIGDRNPSRSKMDATSSTYTLVGNRLVFALVLIISFNNPTKDQYYVELGVFLHRDRDLERSIWSTFARTDSEDISHSTLLKPPHFNSDDFVNGLFFLFT